MYGIATQIHHSFGHHGRAARSGVGLRIERHDGRCNAIPNDGDPNDAHGGCHDALNSLARAKFGCFAHANPAPVTGNHQRPFARRRLGACGELGLVPID
jgi:hypothetical protein